MLYFIKFESPWSLDYRITKTVPFSLLFLDVILTMSNLKCDQQKYLVYNRLKYKDVLKRSSQGLSQEMWCKEKKERRLWIGGGCLFSDRIAKYSETQKGSWEVAGAFYVGCTASHRVGRQWHFCWSDSEEVLCLVPSSSMSHMWKQAPGEWMNDRDALHKDLSEDGDEDGGKVWGLKCEAALLKCEAVFSEALWTDKHSGLGALTGQSDYLTALTAYTLNV